MFRLQDPDAEHIAEHLQYIRPRQPLVISILNPVSSSAGSSRWQTIDFETVVARTHKGPWKPSVVTGYLDDRMRFRVIRSMDFTPLQETNRGPRNIGEKGHGRTTRFRAIDSRRQHAELPTESRERSARLIPGTPIAVLGMVRAENGHEMLVAALAERAVHNEATTSTVNQGACVVQPDEFWPIGRVYSAFAPADPRTVDRLLERFGARGRRVAG